MTGLSEDRVYARHPRVQGEVLIVGAGSVGSLLAHQLAAMGISRLDLVDPKTLKVENIVRHHLGAADLGQSKAIALAQRIRRDLPLCDVWGHRRNFLEYSEHEQLQLAKRADVVVAATDSAECQRRINQVCLEAERIAVYPAVWVEPRMHAAEVGEILWVLPGRHTPCYLCLTAYRQDAPDARAGRGAQADIQVTVLAAARVVAALLAPRDERAQILNEQETWMLVHGFMPASPAVEDIFNGRGIKTIHVPFPQRRCPDCGAQQLDASVRAEDQVRQETSRPSGGAQQPPPRPPDEAKRPQRRYRASSYNAQFAYPWRAYTDDAWNARIDWAITILRRLSLWAEDHR